MLSKWASENFQAGGPPRCSGFCQADYSHTWWGGRPSQVPKLPQSSNCSLPDFQGKVTAPEVGEEERGVGQGGFLVKAPPSV